MLERLAILIDAKAGGAIREIQQLGTTAKVADTSVDGLGKRSWTTRDALDRMGFAGMETSAIMKGALVAAAAAAAMAMYKFGKASIDATAQLADSVRDVQYATNASAQTSSRLVAIFDDYGISGESASRALSKLAREIESGDSKLRTYGVEVARNKSGNIDFEETLLSLADAYASTTDAGARQTLVFEALGRNGRDLIPVLEQGREGVQALFANVPEGQILGQRDLDNALEYKLAVDNLSDAFLELKVLVGTELLPIITDLANGSAGIVRGFRDITDSIPTPVMNELKEGLLSAIPVFGGVINALGDVGVEFGNSSEKADRLKDAQVRLAEAQKEVARLASEGKTQTEAGRKANEEYEDAASELEEVEMRVARAFRSTNDELEDKVSKLQEAISKATEYANTQLGVAGAELNVESAQLRLNEVMADTNSTSLEQREAALNLQRSWVSYGEAVRKEAEAAGNTVQEQSMKQIAALERVAGTLSPDDPLRRFLDDYINRLRNIPGAIDTTVVLSADTGAARSALEAMGIFIDEGAWYVPQGFTTQPRVIVGATGGIVNRPTMALIGEAGPEAVIPLNRSPGNAPLDGLMGTGTITIPLVVDGRVLAEVTASEFNRAGGPQIQQRAIA
jgi:hypothetical protein